MLGLISVPAKVYQGLLYYTGPGQLTRLGSIDGATRSTGTISGEQSLAVSVRVLLGDMLTE